MPLQRRTIRPLVFLLAAGILGACQDTHAPPDPAELQFSKQPLKGVWTVTTLDDPGTGDCMSEYCTLRQAIAAAQNGDRIVFKPNISGVINLTEYLYFVLSDVTIDGGGRITLRAPANASVLLVESGRNVTLIGLTMAGGQINGGVLNNGTLALINSGVVNNHSNLLGGGIYNAGNLTLVNTTVGANSAGDVEALGSGGGIYNAGHLTVVRSAIVFNSARGKGAGIFTTSGATTIVTGSTIAANDVSSPGLATSLGGGAYVDGTMTLRSTTLVGNHSSSQIGIGGGIFLGNSGTLTVSNSIVAGNTASNPEQDCFVAGSALSLGHNLTTDCPFGQATDVLVAAEQVFTEVLKPTGLEDNGGPTPTIALIERGLAVDAGHCPGEAKDQRGFARPYDEPLRPNVGDACDIGALEWRPTTNPGNGPKK